jgi:very-short-patch-repair endonuclease
MPHSAIDRRTRDQAQSLRRRPTDAEQKLWRALRSLKPLGLHFRRQAPIGPYIVDFAWYAGKIVVEVDGGQHAQARLSYDRQRTAWLRSQGFEVLRFWNNDVLQSTAVVAEAILNIANSRRAAGEGPTPDPSPQGGGEKTAGILCRNKDERSRSVR